MLQGAPSWPVAVHRWVDGPIAMWCAGVASPALHQSRNSTCAVDVLPSEYLSVKSPPAGPPSVVVPKKWIFEYAFCSDVRSTTVCPTNLARFGTVPLVFGIRNHTSSCVSFGPPCTMLRDGGISSAGSEYGGSPRIWLLALLAPSVIPIVSKMFTGSGSPIWNWSDLVASAFAARSREWYSTVCVPLPDTVNGVAYGWAAAPSTLYSVVCTPLPAASSDAFSVTVTGPS